MKKLLLMLLALTTLTSISAAERSIYVVKKRSTAPQGALTASTLQGGIDLAGKYKKRGDDVTLYIEGGIYTLDRSLELTEAELGTEGGTLLIQPMEGHEVSLQGGMNLPLSSITPATAAEERVRPELRDKVVRVDLSKAGELGDLYKVGFSRPHLPSWSELFVNGNPQKISRWPNDTMALMGPVIDPGSIPRNADYTNRGGTFRYYDDRPSTWKSTPKWISGYLAHGYADDMTVIGAIDTVKKEITMEEAVMYGLISGSDFNRWFVVNMLEEVDLPGEYYLDVEKKEAWIYPSEEIETLTISTLDEPMMAIEGVKRVEVRGLTFEYSRAMGVYMERTEEVVIRGCRLRNLGAVAISMGKGVEPAKALNHSYSGELVSRVVGSLNEHNYNNPAMDREGGFRNGIVDCVIYDVGAGGISLGSGNRPTLTPGESYVENCRIYRYNRISKSMCPGIYFMGVGNRITNCEIFDAPSSAIIYFGNDLVIEYCNIYDVCKEVDDMGAVYYGRNPSNLGNIFRYNYMHHLSAKHRVTALYHDDGSCGMTVIGNIFYQAGLQPILLGGGSDHFYQHNLFIDMPRGMYVDNRLENWSNTEYIYNKFKRSLEEVNYQQSPFKDKYPQAATYFEQRFQTPKRNCAKGNLYYNIQQTLIQPGERPYERAYLEMYNNWVTWSGYGFEEPGFVDAENENWNLKPDAAIFRYIPGFEATDFDRIGCTLPRESE